MKIKSMLLGSAAAMVAVSGAQAADAIVVEPEPVEYVRVCDMYGAGWFYIPGDANNTCLKFSGYVQAEYWVDHDHDEDDISQHSSRVRTLLRVEANNETQYGTLHSGIRYFNNVYDSGQADVDPSHDEFSSDEGFTSDDGLYLATFSLAGFRIGYDATDYTIWNTYGGYGFYTAVNSGGYGSSTAMFIEYNGTFGDNFNYGIGVADVGVSGAPGQPDLMAGISTSMGALSIGAAVAYDSSESAFAYRVRGDLDLSSFVPGGSLGAWWRADHGDTDYVKGHQWGVTAKMNLVDNLQLYAGYSSYNWQESEDNPTATELDNVDRWTVGAKWDVAPGLFLLVEHAKTLIKEDRGTASSSGGTTWVRMRRSF